MLVWPVAGGGRVVTYFSGWHQAIDIESGCGTAVLAAAGGAITYAGWKDNGGGLVVEIASGDFLLSYNHLGAIAVGGGSVAAGQVIAYVGMTGLATGCHLHFGTIVNGVVVDPLAYL